MVTVLDRLGMIPIQGFVPIRPFPNAIAIPRVGDYPLAEDTFLASLDRGSLPVVWGPETDKPGRLWGSVSLFDFRRDVELASTSRHDLATYDFRKLRVGPGRVGNPIHEPVRESDYANRLVALFVEGTRRVFVVDADSRPIGYIDLGDFVSSLLNRFPQLLKDQPLAHSMLYGNQNLTTCLAANLYQTLMNFNRYRRMVFVYVLGQFTRCLTLLDVIRAIGSSPNDLKTTVSAAFPQACERLPEDSYVLPWPSVSEEATMATVIHPLTVHQELLVTNGQPMPHTRTPIIAGHISLPWLFVRQIEPDLQTQPA